MMDEDKNRKVIVKKRKIEKEFSNMKVVYNIYDVCEIIKNEDGSTEITITQIYDVHDIWDFEDVDILFEK